jgi:hypothetical protein
MYHMVQLGRACVTATHQGLHMYHMVQLGRAGRPQGGQQGEGGAADVPSGRTTSISGSYLLQSAVRTGRWDRCHIDKNAPHRQIGNKGSKVPASHWTQQVRHIDKNVRHIDKFVRHIDTSGDRS